MEALSSGALPDFDRMAAVFDRYLHLIEPVGSAVLGHLPVLPKGARVLDAACGAEEPGEVQSSHFDWNYEFPDEHALWQFVSGPGLLIPHTCRLYWGQR